ncbi:BatD family protein [Vibrio scophthalmi]|uniref:BatD family protein n=1 Tax=Vibrio scophthalmi TaxID=45658 RepID=UPI003EBBA9A0
MVIFKHRTLLALMMALVSLLAFTSNAFAANLWAVVKSNQVTQAEVFQLRLIFDEKVDADAIDFKPLEANFFLGQPSFASSLNFTNGKRSSSSEWTIALKAKSLGRLTIPAFEIEGSYSQPIEMTVNADTDLPKQNDLVEIQSQLSRSTLYPDQNAELTTRLIFKADLRRLQNPNFIAPAALNNSPGLSVTEQGKAKQTTQVINGVEVTVFEQRFLVTAEQAGHYTLNSLGFSATLVHGSNRTGSTKLIPINIAPEAFPLEVKAKPQGFGKQWIPTPSLDLTQRWLDADGNVLSTVSKDKSNSELKVTVGDSITRELTLTVEGLAPERFPQFIVNYPSAIRQYAEKPQYTQLSDGNVKMTVKQVLITQKSGQYVLPNIDLEWWNTASDRKVVTSLNALSLTIEPNELSAAPAVVTPPSLPTHSVVVEYNRGYWPYLTALFALLWISTLAWHIKTRLGRHNEAPHLSSVEHDTTKAILIAIEQQDAPRIQHLIGVWLTEHECQDSPLIDKIKTELEAMNNHIYGEGDSVWSHTQLIKLIKQLAKQTPMKKRQPPQLAKL